MPEMHIEYWEGAVILIAALIWVFLFLVSRHRRRNLVGALRIGTLVAFILALVVFIAFVNQPTAVTLAGILIPLVWGFVDSFLSKARPYKHVVLLLKSANPGYTKELAEAINEESIKLARIRGAPQIHLNVVLPKQPNNPNAMRDLFRDAVDERPDAILISPPPVHDRVAEEAAKAMVRGIPVITIDDKFNASYFVDKGLLPPLNIRSDFEAAGRLAAQQMISALDGKGTVAVISGPRHSKPSQSRKLGFVDEILSSKQDIHLATVLETSWSLDEAREQMARLLRSGIPIDGVFCCSDRIALGALQAVREHRTATANIRWPPIIIGFDGIREIYGPIVAGDVYCSIDSHIKSQGKLVVDHLREILDDKRGYFRGHPAQSQTNPEVLNRDKVISLSHVP